MKKRIYYAICFKEDSRGGRKVSHTDPSVDGAHALFFHRDDAYWYSNEGDKVKRVLVTIEPVPSKKKAKK